MVIWVTGLSGAGKTTLCRALKELLRPKLPQVVMIDGDIVRETFDDGLGYGEKDRWVQVARIQRMARMLSDQGLIVLAAVLYSHPELLQWNRREIRSYYEIYLKTSLDALRHRDYKGIYAQADAGQMREVVGLDIAWHEPTSPDLVIHQDHPEEASQLARKVVASIPELNLLLEPVS